MDIALIVVLSIMLNRKCKSAGVRSGIHIMRLTMYWILCEILGMLIFLRLGYNPLSLLSEIGALLIGGGAGVFSYQKSLREIKTYTQTPQLPQ